MGQFESLSAEDLERLVDAVTDSLKLAVDEEEMAWRQEFLDDATVELEERTGEHLSTVDETGGPTIE